MLPWAMGRSRVGSVAEASASGGGVSSRVFCGATRAMVPRVSILRFGSYWKVDDLQLTRGAELWESKSISTDVA